MAQPSSNMAHPTRLPSLQSRDPRTNASRFETDALRHFLTDTLPPSEKSHVIPEEKVPGQRKQSKRKALLRIMKRRPSQPELVSPVSNVEPLPAGTIARTISGHTVIMIGPNGTSPYPSADTQTHLPGTQPSGSFSHSSLPHTVAKSRPFSTAGVAIHPLSSAKTPMSHGSEAHKRPSLLKSASELQYHFKGLSSATKLGRLYTQTAAGQSEPDYLPSSPTLYSGNSPIVGPHSTTVLPIHVTVQSPSPALSSDQDPKQDPPTPDVNTTATSPQEVDFAQSLPILEAHEGSGDDQVAETEPLVEPSQHSRLMVEVAIQADPIEVLDLNQGSEKQLSVESSPSAPERGQELAIIEAQSTPPESSIQLPAVVPQLPTSPISPLSLRKKSRKAKLPSESNIPLSPAGNSLENIEITKLEDVQDRSRAFKYLFEMYKGQKSLREEGERHYQLKIADLTAALTSQKMINKRLTELLTEKGLSMQDIASHLEETVGPAHLRKDQDSDIAISGSETKLDASRFLMLKKEAQLSRIREFSSSHGNHEPVPAFVGNSQDPLSSTSDLVELAKMPALHPPLTPAPSMPLPAVPSPSPRRAIKSMVVSNSEPAVWSVARSRSLTENNATSSVPFLEAMSIDQNMRRLEKDFESSASRTTGFQTANSGLNLQYVSESGSGEKISPGETSPLGISIPPPIQEVPDNVGTTLEKSSSAAMSECSVSNTRQDGYYVDSAMSSPSLLFKQEESPNITTAASLASSDTGMTSILDPPSHSATPPSERFVPQEQQHPKRSNIRVRIDSTPSPRTRSDLQDPAEGDLDGGLPPFIMDESKWNHILLSFMTRRGETRSRKRSQGKWRPRSAVELRDYFISEEIEQP